MSVTTDLEVLSKHLAFRSGVPWPIIYDALTRAIADIIIRKNSGANVGQRPRLNFIEGANITLTIADDAVDDEVDITITSAAIGGTIVVRRNTGPDVGTRPRLNFIEGANVALTVVDDGVSNEIDITITAADDGITDQFFPIPIQDRVKGTYPGALMTDLVDFTITQLFNIPSRFSSIDTAEVVIIPEGTGNIRRSVATNFGTKGEAYQTHTDSIVAGQVAVTNGELEYLDISAALTGAAAEDLVGIQFTREAEDPLDTVDANVYYLGVYIEGTI